MADRRPLIGITGPDRGGAALWLAAALGVRLAGGRPRRITPARPHSAARLDGLIIGGGADVAPALYGQEPLVVEQGNGPGRSRHWTRRVATWLLFPPLYLLRRLLSLKSTEGRGDQARDELESALIDHADARGLPILGICRGAQLLNVRRGGSLHQDLSDFYTETPQLRTVLPYKSVELAPDSRLATILGRPKCRVNALHSQAIRDPGQGLAVVAREYTTVVQAIEDPTRPFVIGVQWHPEYLPQRPEQRRLFRHLVEAARGVGSTVD